MRIGINARVLLSHRMEGVARYIYETSRMMAEKHPEHQFIYFFDRPFDPQFVALDNMKGVQVGIPARHPVLFKLWFDVSLPRAMKKERIDVLYSGDAYAPLSTNIPIVLVSHDLAFIHYPKYVSAIQSMYYSYYFPKFHQKADTIIAVSQATKDDIVKQYKIDPSKIQIGYNATPEGFEPIDEEAQQKVRKIYSEGKPYFIYLGSMHPRKNVHKLIEAFSLYRKNNQSEHKLLLVGRKAWKYGDIDQAYQKSEFRTDIHFLHDIEDEAKLLMASAEALVYVSVFEGFGIPILEAFSSGVPVITSNISSMPEVAGEAAILVDPNSVESIANGMHRMTSDSRLRSQLIQLGLKRKEEFSWETTANTIFAAIEKAYKS